MRSGKLLSAGWILSSSAPYFFFLGNKDSVSKHNLSPKKTVISFPGILIWRGGNSGHIQQQQNSDSLFLNYISEQKQMI